MNKRLSILLMFLVAWVVKKTEASHNHSIDAKSDIGFTATVYIDDMPKCTATLISRMWALTTCLCVLDVAHTRVFVRIGDPTIAKGKKHQFYKSDKVELHPQCLAVDGSYNNENDIALIMLFEPFFDSRYVFIAKIPYQLTFWTPDSTLGLDLASYTDFKDQATTLGEAVWHTTSYILHPGVCLKHLRNKNYKPGKSMCASYFHKNHTGDCRLDLGAPLAYDYTLIGILVFKENGCGQGSAVASFVNVPLHSQWIRETTAKNTPWINL